jgi:hypothetical protein
MTVSQLVNCINQRDRKHRSAVINEDIAYGDWLLDKKEEVRSQGDLWGRAFEDPRMESNLGKAEKFMAIAKNSVMRNLRMRRFWPGSFYVRYLLSTIPESRLQEVIDAGRIHPKFNRDEAEALVRQCKRVNSASRHRLVSFGRSINGGVGCDLWHNRLDEVFGARVVGRKCAPGTRLYKLAKRHLLAAADVLKATLAISTLLPDDRHWPGDGQPKKWPLLLRYLFQHEKVGAFLQDLSQMPFEQQEAYIERHMREAYKAYRAEGVAVETSNAEAADAEAA